MRRFLAIAAVLGVSAWAFAAYVINPPQFNVSLNCYTSASGACLPVSAPAISTGFLDAGSAYVAALNVGSLTTAGAFSLNYGTNNYVSSDGAHTGVSGSTYAALVGGGVFGIVCTSSGCYSASGFQVSPAQNSTSYTNFCDCAQGGCSMANTNTCTCACLNCTASSICYSSVQSNAGTTDAVGPATVCASGTVTITAKAGTTGTETFNVHCNN